MCKKIFPLLFVLCATGLTVFAQAKKNFKVEVTVSDVKEGVLLIKNLTRPLPDTMVIKNGIARYDGFTPEPTPFILLDEANKYQLFFAAPNDNIKITLNKKDMLVTFLGGAAAHEIFRELIVAQEPMQVYGGKIQQELQNPKANTDSLNRIMDGLNQNLKSNFYTFLKKHSSSEVTAFVVYSAINNDRNIKTAVADTMFAFLTGKAKTSFYGNELSKMLGKLRAIEVGYNAPDFTLPDSTGVKKYSLSSLKGKYVLVDFWASWCGPCKQEIPYLKEAYNKYHNKGFEIMSISLDDKKIAWTNALKLYEMPWIHVSDIKGFNSIVNDLYHVPSIPKTLLLDKTGKIIATDLRGPALDEKLEKLLGK